MQDSLIRKLLDFFESKLGLAIIKIEFKESERKDTDILEIQVRLPH